jgi:YcaO-like protein with predicted kinase domain
MTAAALTGTPRPTLRERLAEPSPKGYRAGTDRLLAPEETLAKVMPVARQAGVTRLAGVGGLDRLGLPVYCAIRPTSRNLAVSQGKGATVAAAKVSAVMESLELWHAERHRLPVRYDRADRLAAGDDLVIDVGGVVKCPCNEFRTDRLLRWTAGHELGTGRAIWVPYEAVHTDWRLPTAYGEHAFQNGSNGLASGNTLVEAVVHALCEVIERDAIVRFDSLPAADSVRRKLELSTVQDPECQRLIGHFVDAGIDLVVWDMTSPVGVPTYSCVAVEVDAPWYQPLPQTQGSGTHPVRRVALLRAITETAQARAAIIAGSRDDIFDERYATYFDPQVRQRAAREVAIPATRSFDALSDADADTANGDLAWLLRQLAGQGHHQVAVVDLTDPHLGVPVVKVVVPGLQWRPWEE